jgi:TRAP-type C4-dicarboxylate transport system permease small subunit
MASAYRRAMEAFYLACVVIAGGSLVVITLIIPWGVYTRYVLDSGSAWPEPMSILLMIAFTFAGAAAVYRANGHIAVTLVADRVPPVARTAMALAVEALMALLSVFMVIWGMELVELTWDQVIAEFPFLSVGVTYLPIPIGGAVTLLFIVERLWLGLPPGGSIVWREPASAD